MRLVLLGAPGAGKGTQASMLSEKLKIPHVSTGDIFRSNIKNGTGLGRKAKEFIDKGMLVPDEITIDIIKDRLQQEDCKKGFILDGFPRTILQAEYLENTLKDIGVNLNTVINIYVPDEEIIKRLSGRRVCPDCGASYHIVYNPTVVENTCGFCRAKVVQREDDREETVVSRLKTYHMQTEPLIEYYREKGRLRTVSGQGNVENTSMEILKVLGLE